MNSAEKHAPTPRRGGLMNSPGHALQIILVLALLTASAVLFVKELNLPAIALLVVGGVIAFINRRA